MRNVTLRLAMACAYLGSTLLINTLGPVAAQASNPITIENQLPGTTAWQPGQGGRVMATDTAGQIKGYASKDSVNVGEQIELKVSVNPTQTFALNIYRMGWYGGTRGRLVHSAGTLNGARQADCPIVDMASHLIECNWSTAYTLTVPLNWTSGVHLVHLISASGHENYVLFVVRNDARTADFHVSLPTSTYQAYNAYPVGGNGASFYTSSPRAARVSYDRPYSGRGDGIFFSGDNDFVSWIEREGFDIKYITSIDLHAHGEQLRTAKGYLSVGHDEYWSLEMHNAAVAARDAGVNLAFFSANDVYWMVRMEPSGRGQPNRVVVGYKEFNDPILAEPYKSTRKYQDLDLPGQQLVGVQYDYGRITQTTGVNTVWLAGDTSHWVYAGSGLTEGQPITGILGPEMDRLVLGYARPISTSYTTLSRSPFVSVFGITDTAESAIYQAPSGAWVFATGTINWAHGLDRPGVAHEGIRKVTKNILERFVTSSVPQASRQLAMLSVPLSDAQIGGIERFYWAPGLNAQGYRLQIGTQPGASDIWNGAETSALSELVSNLPANGGTFYTSLWTKVNGAWTSNFGDNKTQLTYNALPKILLSPMQGKVLGSPSQTFSWNAIPNAQSYYINIGSTFGGKDIYSGASAVMTKTNTVISGLPADGRILHVAVWWRVSGKYRTTNYSFVAAGGRDSSLLQREIALPLIVR